MSKGKRTCAGILRQARVHKSKRRREALAPGSPTFLSTFGPPAFFDWINERHCIYLKKEAGLPKPWTDDRILQDYKFTNVFRELDRVTVWIREHWREPYADHPNLWFAMCVARQINLPETLEAIGFPEDCWDWRRATRIMDERKAAGLPVYTGAYMITASYKEITQDGQSKNETYCKNVLGEVWAARKKDPWWEHWHLETAWKALTRYRGFGPFMAYEVISDLRWTRYFKDAPDIMTWANAGPGAIRGLNRVCARPTDAKLSPDQALREMQILLDMAPDYLERHVPVEKMEMREIEHCLCEFDKYMRVKLKEGRPRARYNGRE